MCLPTIAPNENVNRRTYMKKTYMETNKAWKHTVVLFFLLFALGGSLFLSVGCGPKSDDAAEIRIAIPVPMTGQFREYGLDLIRAARIAVEEANEAGGVHGRTLVLVTEDDKGDPRDAVTVAQRIVQDSRIIGVMGHLNSGTMLAAVPIYGDAGMPVVMPVPTNPQITRQGFRNFFRVPITDDKQGAAAYDFLSARADRNSLAVVHNRETYGRGIADEFVRVMEADGAAALLFEGVNPNDPDYRPVVNRIRAANGSGIFFGGEYADAARFIRQAREQGLEVPIVMGDGAFNPEMANIAGDAVRNTYVANIAPINAPSPEARRFYERFEEEHERIVAYAPLGYVATQILIDAMSRAETPTRENVLAVLQDPGYDFPSILGPMEFDEVGDSKGRRVFWHKLVDGRFVAIDEKE